MLCECCSSERVWCKTHFLILFFTCWFFFCFDFFWFVFSLCSHASSSILFSHPGYFGKVGMRTFHYTDNRHYCPTVNVEALWNLLPKDAQEQAEKDKSKAPVLDVTAAVCCLFIHFHSYWWIGFVFLLVDFKNFLFVFFFQGFSKVLGRGSLPKVPLIVKAKFFSRIAEKKIKAVGGICELTGSFVLLLLFLYFFSFLYCKLNNFSLIFK